MAQIIHIGATRYSAPMFESCDVTRSQDSYFEAGLCLIII